MTDVKDTLPSYTPMHDSGVLKQWEFLIKMWSETKSSLVFCDNSSIQVNETILDETLFLKCNVKTKILYFTALFF